MRLITCHARSESTEGETDNAFNSEHITADTLICLKAEKEMQRLLSNSDRKALQVLSELARAGAAFRPDSSGTSSKQSAVDGSSPVTQCRLAILSGPSYGEGVLKVEVRAVLPCMGSNTVMHD